MDKREEVSYQKRMGDVLLDLERARSVRDSEARMEYIDCSMRELESLLVMLALSDD